MKRLLISFSFCVPIFAQTVVYVRTSGPGPAQITNAQTCVNSTICGTTIQITIPDHGFSSSCGTGSTTCYIDVNGVVNTSGATYANGIRTAKYIDANDLALYDTSNTPVGSSLTWSGTWSNGQLPGYPGGAQWGAQVTPYTLPPGPNGWLDGANGNLMHKLVLGPGNGTTTGPNGLASTNGVAVSGCPSACVISVTTNSYNPTTATLPLQTGNYFTIFGTGTVLDSTGASSCAGAGTPAIPVPYTVNTVSSTGWTSTSFSCSSLSNGDYTNKVTTCGPAALPNGTIGGSQSCTTVSQIAYGEPGCDIVGGVTSTSNPAWCWLAKLSESAHLDDTSGIQWKGALDGGASNNETPSIWNTYAAGALRFIVDRSNAYLFRDIHYFFNEPELSGGVSWPDDESQGSGGGCGEIMAYYTGMMGAALTFSAAAPYESTASVNTFLNKMYNNVDNPANTVTKTGVEISSTNATNGAITYYTATGTSLSAPSGNTLQLQNGASAIVNQLLWLGTNPLVSATYGLISSVSGCTGSGSCAVTVSSWNGAVPSTTTPYTVYATVIWGPSPATTANGASTEFTITGATAANLNINAGDAIMASNGWWSGYDYLLCKVTSVSGSTGNCYNSYSVQSANLSTNQMIWHFPAISVSSSSITGATGNPGLLWNMYHVGLQYGATPLLWPQAGGTSTLNGFRLLGYGDNQYGVISAARIALDIAAAAYDQRAIRDLAIEQGSMWDFIFAHYMSYSGNGWLHDGSQYSNFVSEGLTLFAWLMNINFPTAPSMYPTGPWGDFPKYQEYILLPDFYSSGNSGEGQPVSWGADPSSAQIAQNGSGDSNSAYSQLFDPTFWFAPSSISSQYHANWARNVLGSGLNLLWGAGWDTGPEFALFYDPRIPGTSYQNQPLQYELALTNQPQTTGLTGAGFPENVAGTQGLGMVSRTCWNNYGGSGANCTVVFGRFAAFAGEHDQAGPQVSIFKRGLLVDLDGGALTDNQDQTTTGSAVQFGGIQGELNEFNSGLPTASNVSTVTPLAWASANHGSWAAQYGDQNSTYAHQCVDAAGMYQSNWNVSVAIKCLTDFKRSGYDQFVVEQDEVFLTGTNTTEIQRAIHYPQNGTSNPLPEQAYPTGTTICTNTAGTQVPCSSLNSYGRIESTEQSAQGYGVITQIYSPGTVNLTWACPGSGNAPQCSPANRAQRLGASFGFGYSDPVIIAGGSTLGGSVNSLEDVIVHKIMNGLSDTTFKSSPLNPSSSWTGVDACGANSGIGYLRLRSNSTAASVPGFTTSQCPSLPYQYLISGISPGTYTVTVGGSAVSGSPFTVSAGDTTIEFTGVAGTVSVNAGVISSPAASSIISGQATAGGNVIIH